MLTNLNCLSNIHTLKTCQVISGDIDTFSRIFQNNIIPTKVWFKCS